MRFVCYNGIVGGSPFYVLSSISLNWKDAQIFCRAHYVDLASIRNQTENEMIRRLIGASNVWIGLYGERLWSDGSPSLFRHWVDGQPNDYRGDQCIAGSFYSGRWWDEVCSLKMPFICYKPRKLVGPPTKGPNVVGVKIQVKSLNVFSESKINAVLTEFFKHHGLQPQSSLKVRSATPEERKSKKKSRIISVQ
ncbi:lectin BRA-3-like isoform X2 [Fundulus heteroclitus]|uniref:lectin BRA-3-like isoform X2 n=1 Tax=Fundulus heteroclitus TaxID=8078 RepID=UPI00165BDCFD|nr:lectin BRA-3-like isoform X2 [Fundulus heteroclitus]